MISNRLAIVALRLSGLLVLMIGVAHFFMPEFGYNPEVIKAIPKASRNHFAYLGTYAIGMFLVFIAILTLLAKPDIKDAFHQTFLVLMVVVWSVRFVLELIFPVTLSLFFVNHPHPVLLATMALIWFGYVIAFLNSTRFYKDARTPR